MPPRRLVSRVEFKAKSYEDKANCSMMENAQEYFVFFTCERRQTTRVMVKTDVSGYSASAVDTRFARMAIALLGAFVVGGIVYFVRTCRK